MKSIELPFQAALDAATSVVRTTAAAVAARVCESLGHAASASLRIAERDLLIATQFELRSRSGAFESVFFEALREKVRHEVAPAPEAGRKGGDIDWQTLSLVENREVEERINFERIGQMISHECETELRELAAYMGTVTGIGRADEERNPLRGDVIGAALYRGIEAVSSIPDHRKILVREIAQAMAHAMPPCYAEILRLLQQRGVHPVGLTVRTVDGPGHHLPGLNSAYDRLAPDRASTHSAHGDLAEGNPSESMDLLRQHRRTLAAVDAAAAERRFGPGGEDPQRGAARGPERSGDSRPPGLRGDFHGQRHGQTGYGRDAAAEHAQAPANELRARGDGFDSARHRGPRTGGTTGDAELMSLLRRLTALASGPGELSGGPAAAPSARAPGGATGFDVTSRAPSNIARQGLDSRFAPRTSSGAPSTYGSAGGTTAFGSSGAESDHAEPVNLIRAHREALIQASSGKLDHMVIDVVGSLFDQILSDSRVPPQMARQIARLQLPVLRVALSDPTFFSTRRHPVRRFINRIASLACAFEDFDDGPGKQFLDRVAQLVKEIVEGDFDQIEIYSAKLLELESFIAEQTEGAAERSGAVGTLAVKETELQIQQRYMQQLRSGLAPIALPSYLGDFLTQVWSQALVLASRRDGPESDRAKRFRRVGCDIVMSIQPKGSPVLRKRFLMQLPPLMKDLNEGMHLIGWPAAAQRDFFSQLLPAHAESLKGHSLTELEHNLLVKQLEAIFAVPVPGMDAISPLEPVPAVDPAAIEQRFTQEEAQRVGLVTESAVDWGGPVDIDLSGPEPDVPAASPRLVIDAVDSTRSLPLSDREVAEAPSGGSASAESGEAIAYLRQLDQIKLGFAYEMHLKDDWQKVRLAHVSPGRSFFVFSRGAKHQETISMTARMLARMCDTGRMRAVESAYLMERATHRARQQLAELNVPTRH